MAQNNQKQDWRKVMLTQYSIFGSIAGLEVALLAIFATFLKNTISLWEKILFSSIALLLFLEIIGILWLINQERKVAFGNRMQCFREKESTYRLILNIVMVLTWLLILILLLVHIW